MTNKSVHENDKSFPGMVNL